MAHSSTQSLSHIQNLPLFDDLDAREQSILASVFRVRHLEEGEVLCREGAKGDSFFITVAGEIEIRKEVASGGSERLSTIGPNNVLGQVSLIDRKARSATMRASRASIVLECSAADFDRLFFAGTPFAYKLLDMMTVELSRRLRDADRALYEIYSNPAETLLKLHEAAIDIQRTLHDQNRF